MCKASKTRKHLIQREALPHCLCTRCIHEDGLARQVLQLRLLVSLLLVPSSLTLRHTQEGGEGRGEEGGGQRDSKGEVGVGGYLRLRQPALVFDLLAQEFRVIIRALCSNLLYSIQGLMATTEIWHLEGLGNEMGAEGEGNVAGFTELAEERLVLLQGG